MTHALDDPAHPPLDEATACSHAAELRALAEVDGITNLRFASTGRLLGHLEPDRDDDDMADFELGAEARRERSFLLVSDRVLSRHGVSPDLLSATAL